MIKWADDRQQKKFVHGVPDHLARLGDMLPRETAGAPRVTTFDRCESQRMFQRGLVRADACVPSAC